VFHKSSYLYDLNGIDSQAADYAIVFVGLDQSQETEGLDRYNISLPGVQNELVQAVATTSTPVVVVLINGGALAIEWIKANIPAIVEAFYPGTTCWVTGRNC